MCDRTACDTQENKYKIWNDITAKGYREYCLECGSKIIGFNQARAQHNQEELLEWEFIEEEYNG